MVGNGAKVRIYALRREDWASCYSMDRGVQSDKRAETFISIDYWVCDAERVSIFKVFRGDTDTNGCIIGAMIGASVGYIAL